MLSLIAAGVVTLVALVGLALQWKDPSRWTIMVWKLVALLAILNSGIAITEHAWADVAQLAGSALAYAYIAHLLTRQEMVRRELVRIDDEYLLIPKGRP